MNRDPERFLGSIITGLCLAIATLLLRAAWSLDWPLVVRWHLGVIGFAAATQAARIAWATAKLAIETGHNSRAQTGEPPSTQHL